METSAKELEYKKHWRRFTKLVNRGVVLMRLFGLQVDKAEFALPLDWEDVTRDYRPVSGDVKAAADQGVGQRAAAIDGAEEARRNWKHEQVDDAIADRGLLKAVELIGESDGWDAALEYLDHAAFGHDDPTPDELWMEAELTRAEVTDLMSKRLDRQPQNLSAAPLGDLWGEQLHWKSTNIELLDDGTLRVWKKDDRGQKWHSVQGVLKGRQTKYQRWADQRAAELHGVEAPKVTRETLGEYTKGRNEERKIAAIEAAMLEAVEMVMDGSVPDPSIVGRGRPKWVWVCLSALGNLHVSKATEPWAGRVKVDRAVAVLAEWAVEELISA